MRVANGFIKSLGALWKGSAHDHRVVLLVIINVVRFQATDLRPGGLVPDVYALAHGNDGFNRYPFKIDEH